MRFKLQGKWRAGYAFDIHTVASDYLGENQYGHGVWDNTRSEMGELVFQLKNRGKLAAVPKIVDLLKTIRSIEKFDYIVPVPSSNKARRFQPVDEIAKALGRQRGVKVLIGFLEKDTKGVEIKSIDDPLERARILAGSITIKGKKDVSGKTVLLLDDLYRSGVTLSVCCDALKKQAMVGDICVLVMTKTRTKR